MNEPLLEKESGCVKIDTSTSQYPDRESNAELSLRRTLLYPFNYQGSLFGCEGTKKRAKYQIYLSISYASANTLPSSRVIWSLVYSQWKSCSRRSR